MRSSCLNSLLSCGSSFRVLVLICAFSVLQAFGDPLPANSKVLFLGPAATTHGPALQSLIDGDSTVNGLGIQVDSYETDILLSAFYEKAANWQLGGSYTQPHTPNPLLNKLDEDYDVIVIHPDRLILLWPEHFMESVRLIQRYVEPLGSKVMLIVPPHSSTQTMFPLKTYEYPSDNATMVKEQVYRIGDALDLEVIPAGLTWQELEQDPAITTPEFRNYSYSFSYIPDHYSPDLYAANVYATTLYSALFEASASQSTYRHGGISHTEFAAISAYAYSTWQASLTATHYTGEHLGMISPVIPTPAYPGVLYDPAFAYTTAGASTEGFTAVEFDKIMRRKGIEPFRDGSGPFEFVIDRYSSTGLGDKVVLYQKYKKSIYGMVQEFTQEYAMFYNPYRRPNNKVNPNYMAFTRLWTENPSFEIGNIGDGHVNQHGSMMMAAGVYTIMTGGEHPFLDGTVDLTDWTGPQRYAASIGYGTVMGAGKLAKLEEPPVSVGDPRHYVQREAPNVVTLTGFDFDGLPVSVVIDTPPQYGTFVANGTSGPLIPYSGITATDFVYTPQTGFDGLDSVTYHVINANGTSQPLTVYLSVGPYEPEAPAGVILFEEDFDDQDISDWSGSTNYEFAVSGARRSWLGEPQPYDGTAALRLWSGNVEKPVSTTAFENLVLTIRVGAGLEHNSFIETQLSDGHVEWYDGSNWHTLLTHELDPVNNQLLQTYQVVLPAGAADNPEFRLRLKHQGYSASPGAAFFDSIVLSGEVIPRPPVVQDGAAVVAMNDSVEIQLVAADDNPFDTFTYTVNDPANGSVSGIPPLVTYTPDLNFTGTDTFTFSVNDGTFDSGTATVTVTVRDNSAPVVDAGEDQIVNMTVVPYWTPGDTTTAGWYDATDAGSIVHTGGAVSQWQDKSGNGLHLNQSGAGEQPLTGSETLNGLNAIRFDGTNDVLVTSTNPFGASIEDALVYVVHREDGRGSGPSGHLFSLSGAGGKTWNAQAPNSLGYVRFWVNGDGLTNSYGIPQGDIVMTGFYGSTTENVLRIFTNGSLLTEKAFTKSGQATTGNIFIGSNAETSFQKMSLGELVIVSNTVSDGDRQKFEGYLAHKWGLVAELPLDHPYKATPPGGPYATFDLLGAVSDGESDPLITEWTQVSGPGQAEFTSTTDATTTVTLREPGTYVFRLTSDDGLEVTVDEVTITIPEPMVDSDSDGLDDAWELEHFDTLADTDGTIDSDGDGVMDFAEYLTGTDPNAGGDVGLILQAGPSAHGPANVFKWTVKDGLAPGQHYEVMYSTDLSGWNPMPPEHYTLTSSPAGEMTEVEMEITHDYGGAVFVTLDRP